MTVKLAVSGRPQIEKSEGYKEAVRALSKLLEAEGLNSISLAHAEAVEKNLQTVRSEKYGKTRGVTIAFQHLVDGLDPVNVLDPRVHSMGLDHSSERWKPKAKRASVIESQPYNLSLEQLRAIITGSDEMGLTVTISGESWHMPGRTLLVEFTKKG